MQPLAAYTHASPKFGPPVASGPRADIGVLWRVPPGAESRAVRQIVAQRQQPRERATSFEPASARDPRVLVAIELAGATPGREPIGTIAPGGASAAFYAQQLAQARPADAGDEPGLLAEASAAYRATAERGVTMLGPEIHVSYSL